MTRRMISPELVGRAEAVAQVLAAFASAEAGETRHVLVSGEAGVGKTRLLARTAELVRERGGRVLLGGCVSMGDAALPFAPYAEIVRGLVAQDGAAETAALAGHSASGSCPPRAVAWAATTRSPGRSGGRSHACTSRYWICSGASPLASPC